MLGGRADGDRIAGVRVGDVRVVEAGRVVGNHWQGGVLVVVDTLCGTEVTEGTGGMASWLTVVRLD